MVTGVGVGLDASLDRFEAVALARGVGSWASVNGSSAIEGRVRSKSTFCISWYIRETGPPTEGLRCLFFLRSLNATERASGLLFEVTVRYAFRLRSRSFDILAFHEQIN
jgi:hypothetical protein